MAVGLEDAKATRRGRGVLAWLLALVIAIHPQHSRHYSTPAKRLMPTTPASVTRHAFGRRWRVAWCIAWYESRHTLTAVNGVNRGPWQISITAHPWANPWLLTHSWRYSAIAASRISHRGRDWSAWTTHGLCGV